MKNSKNINNNTLSEYSHFILYNTSNYKLCIENSVSEILNKFVRVIVEYMRFISEKLTMKNDKYHNFIFERGLETLVHVFSIIFYYTKNLELSFYHTQKAYYFYIEFIEQISDDNITFLQLTSRDAIMFVYKKTIFDLNNEFRKNIKEPNLEEKKTLEIVESNIYIYKIIVLYAMNYNKFNRENKKDYVYKCCNLVETISEALNQIKHNQIECVHLFTMLLYDSKIELLDFFKLLEEFINRITKKKIDEKVIKNKIYELKMIDFINNNELNKIEYIFD